MADVDLKSPSSRHYDDMPYAKYKYTQSKKVCTEDYSLYESPRSYRDEDVDISDAFTPPQKSRMTMDEFLDGLSILSAVFLIGMMSWAHTQSCYYSYC